MIKEKNDRITGHLLALFTAFVWGVTFVSTKVLLSELTAVGILVYRFALGYLILWILYPHRIGFNGINNEAKYIAAGFFGTACYQLLENVALSYTQASNVSIIVSSAPFFIGICSWIVFKERIKIRFIIGFILAMAGIVLINYNGSVILELNPKGDMLALTSAFVWALYSMFVRMINEQESNVLASTRRIFFYGLIFMIPIATVDGFKISSVILLAKPQMLFNILFLGVIASGLCFVTWNGSVKHLGPVKASVYIYLQPVITLIFSIIFLKEKVGIIGIVGMILVLMGLVFSEYKKASER